MLLSVVFLLFTTRWGLCFGSEDICQVCDCIPFGTNPLQAFCTDKGFGNKVFSPTTSSHTSLELVYILGIKTVHLEQNSFTTENPVTLIIQNCSTVQVSDYALTGLRTLIMQGMKMARVGALDHSALWTILFHDIESLTLDDSIFQTNYSVHIRHIGDMTVMSTQEERACDKPELHFTIFDSVISSLSEGGLTVCGSQIALENNTFKSVAGGGLQIVAETRITITNNNFQHLDKKAFNITSPEININSNLFATLPAGALSGVSTLQEAFFTNNTIQDIDLGGILLDMGWDMIVEGNIIECDCASKRTSILNPKHDMLYLTNSSYEKLQNIFLNNYCNFNCTVTLKAFSYALTHGEVCVTNDTQLEQGELCYTTILSEIPLNNETEWPLASAASRVEFLVPLSIVVVTILIMSSVCYGCREMKTFKFVFQPQGNSGPKIP